MLIWVLVIDMLSTQCRRDFPVTSRLKMACSEKFECVQNKDELLSELKSHQARAAQSALESTTTVETLTAEIDSLKSELAVAQRKAENADAAMLKNSEDHKASIERLEVKVDNQKQVSLHIVSQRAWSSLDKERLLLLSFFNFIVVCLLRYETIVRTLYMGHFFAQSSFMPLKRTRL